MTFALDIFNERRRLEFALELVGIGRFCYNKHHSFPISTAESDSLVAASELVELDTTYLYANFRGSIILLAILHSFTLV
jgi:hypothetical protein